MKSNYRKLKLKMFLQIAAAAVLTATVGTALMKLLLGFLPTSFANSFISFCMQVFFMTENDAVRLYQQLFVFNREKILMAAFAILLVLFLFFAVSRFIRYFNQISKGIDRLLDDSEQPIQLKSELVTMENKLNAVKGELKKRENAAIESEQRKNDLVVYLAHDLKTPLTSVIGYLNLLKESPDMPTEQRAKSIDISLGKALRLEALINEFFDITRFSFQNIQLNKEQTDLSLMLEQLTEEFYPLLSTKKMEVLVHAEDALTLNGDANQLARVFNNLLKNAIAYGDENSDIVISAQRQEDGILISFKNRGSEISEQQIKHIFEKFYRLDSARSTYSGGAGLGLAIAKKIVELHGGVITAQSNPEFTEFIVTLPLSS